MNEMLIAGGLLGVLFAFFAYHAVVDFVRSWRKIQIELEVGNSYRTRDGLRVFTITEISPHWLTDTYTYIGVDQYGNPFRFDKNGRFTDGKCHVDLVEEVK